MPGTFSQIYIQLVFAVKGRQNFITEKYREDLQKYITGIVSRKKQKTYAVYCMPDHTHLFASLSPAIAISDLVRDIKSNSTTFLKQQGISRAFNWQEGFGAFSYSKSQAHNVVEYVMNQPIHHRKKTFKQEYVQFLKSFEIEYNEKFLFEFYD